MMEIAGNPARQAIARWAEQVRDCLKSCGDAPSANVIEEELARYQAETFQVAVIGKAKRGKSTLINALLGRRDDLVAPIDRLPASSTITRFSWAESDSAEVVFQDGHREAIGYTAIRAYATEEANPGNHKRVNVIEVKGPFPGLEPELILVDTPGAGSLHAHHDALLHGFIPQADAVIFLTTARMPLDRDELDLIRAVRASDVRKIAFAVNMVDQGNPKDLEDGIAHNLRLLEATGLSGLRLHRISAKRAYEGDWPGSGLNELIAEIREFIARSKGQVLDTWLITRVHRAAGPTLLALESERAARGLTTAQRQASLVKLQRERDEVVARRRGVEDRFLREWNQAIAEFEATLRPAEGDVIRAIHETIAVTTVLGVGALKKALPSEILRMIESRLREPAARLERNLDTALARLDSDYPAMDVLTLGRVVLRVRGDDGLAAGVLKGSLMVAAGAGLTAWATTVSTATVSSGFLGLLGSYFSASAWTSWAAGTALAAVAGPLALVLTTAGALTIPWSWTLSRFKLKEQLFDPSRDLIAEVFTSVRAERLGALREVGPALLEAYRLDQERRVEEIERALCDTTHETRSDAEIAQRVQRLAELQATLARHPVGAEIYADGDTPHRSETSS